MGKAFTEEEVKLIRNKLLQEGEKIFVEKGLKKANIKDFTSAVGIALGSFYRFFESKEELFLELIEIYNNKIFDLLKKNLAEQIKTNNFSLEELIMANFKNMKKMPIYMMNFERKEEYDYLLNKISEEKLNKSMRKEKEILEYILDVYKEHGQCKKDYDKEIVEEISQYMFIGLVNKSIIGYRVVEEVLRINAKIMENYVKGSS